MKADDFDFIISSQNLVMHVSMSNPFLCVSVLHVLALSFRDFIHVSLLFSRMPIGFN